jgi:hypothetical protein
LSVLTLLIYGVAAIVYTVFRFISFPLILVVSESVMGLSVLAFLSLLLFHTKRVHFTMYTAVLAAASNNNN